MRGAAHLSNPSVWEVSLGGFTWSWEAKLVPSETSRDCRDISYHPTPSARLKSQHRAADRKTIGYIASLCLGQKFRALAGSTTPTLAHSPTWWALYTSAFVGSMAPWGLNKKGVGEMPKPGNGIGSQKGQNEFGYYFTIFFLIHTMFGRFTYWSYEILAALLIDGVCPIKKTFFFF